MDTKTSLEKALRSARESGVLFKSRERRVIQERRTPRFQRTAGFAVCALKRHSVGRHKHMLVSSFRGCRVWKHHEQPQRFHPFIESS